MDFRYIGVSVDPANRLKQHLYQLNTTYPSTNLKKVRWMQKTIAAGHEIRLTVLKQFGDEESAYVEEEWTIKHLLSQGHNLTNLTSGGRGGLFSDPEALKRLSEKAMISKDTDKFRESQRQKALDYYSSEEAREVSRQFAFKRWNSTPSDQRTPWNKGMTFSEPKPDKMVRGSEEFREHARRSTTEYFENLRKDAERLEEYRTSRLEVGKKVAPAKKKEWANLSEDQYALRCRNMALGRRLGKAKRNGWVLDLTPKPTRNNCENSTKN
jgi:predicted GIY-YIG superfamily endonuclease